MWEPPPNRVIAPAAALRKTRYNKVFAPFYGPNTNSDKDLQCLRFYKLPNR
jgi:hypothetical protein